MNSFEAFREYCAIKTHFSSSKFDYFKYNGHVRVSPESFARRNDIIHFERLSDHFDIKGLLVSHLVENPDIWIGDIVNNQTPYRERKRVLDSLYRVFTHDLEAFERIAAAIRFSRGEIPGLLQQYLSKRISLETASILNDITGATEIWRRHGIENFLEPTLLRLEKYQPFLVSFTQGGYSRQKYTQAVRDFFGWKTLSSSEQTTKSVVAI